MPNAAASLDAYQLFAMDARTRLIFLALVMTQAAHSVEEYVFRLYEVFPLTRFMSGLVSDNLAAGFAVLNVAIVLFGLWCYAARVRRGAESARAWVWPWVVVEFCNGVVHIVLAAARRGYFPGLVTAPLLLALSSLLAIRMLRHRPGGGARV
jgi:hypothetical protein